MNPDSTCLHCSALPFTGLGYDEELSAKRVALREALAVEPVLSERLPVELSAGPELRPSPLREGYRNTVKLVFGWDRLQGRARLGIYEPGSHRLVDLLDCRHHHPAMAPVLQFVCEGVRRHGLPVYHQKRAKGFLRYLLLRVLHDGRMLCCFVTTHDEGGWQESLLALAEELRAAFPDLRSVSQNLNPTPGNTVLGSVTRVLVGQVTVPCRFLDTPVAVTATSFLQANLTVFRLILVELAAWIAGLEDASGPPLRVADLYSGSGAIGLSVTRLQPLLLLESEHASQVPLIEAARADGREDIEVVSGRVQDCLTSLELFEPDLVIVDPPRKGLDPALLEHLRAQPPRALAYLSCNPRSLAGDLAALLGDPAWRVERLQAFDMMPGTEHVECLALLRRD